MPTKRSLILSATGEPYLEMPDTDQHPVANIPDLPASIITSGVLALERGGLESDISPIIKGDLLVGTGPATVGLLSGGIDGEVLMKASTEPEGVAWGSVALPPPEVALFSEEQPAFTNGGATNGTVQTRVLNTTDQAQAWASLAANTVTLDAGVYSFRYSTTAWNRFICSYLANITAASYLHRQTDHCGSSDRLCRRWFDLAPLALAVATDIQIKMWGEDSAGDPTALGQLLQGGPDAVPTKFCILHITKWQ